MSTTFVPIGDTGKIVALKGFTPRPAVCRPTIIEDVKPINRNRIVPAMGSAFSDSETKPNQAWRRLVAKTRE